MLLLQVRKTKTHSSSTMKICTLAQFSNLFQINLIINSIILKINVYNLPKFLIVWLLSSLITTHNIRNIKTLDTIFKFQFMLFITPSLAFLNLMHNRSSLQGRHDSLSHLSADMHFIVFLKCNNLRVLFIRYYMYKFWHNFRSVHSVDGFLYVVPYAINKEIFHPEA